MNKTMLLLSIRGCYRKFTPVIFLDHLQTRKFVQSLASDPRENKSLWSNSCNDNESGGFPQVDNKNICGRHKDNKALLFALEYQITQS